LNKKIKNSIPLVTIAIVTYNQIKYLRECIESCLSQDYPNIEIVVADDASDDGTQEMLQEYSKKYPGKFLLQLATKNMGITENSNRAHKVSSGKYIAWMGGDDLMLPGKISKQVKLMESDPECSICYHNLEVFDSDTNETIRYFNEKFKYTGDVSTLIRYGSFNGACSNLVRTDKTPIDGFDKSLPVASDWLYWIETLGNGGTIRYIDEVLGRYRRHSNNITRIEKNITQNELDHLFTCQILITRFPNLLKDILYSYSNKLINIRHKLPYFDVLIASLRINLTIRGIVLLTVYLFSLKKLRL